MADPKIKVTSKTGANVAIALDDGSASTNVTPAGTELTKEFLLCTSFQQALLDHRVEFDVTQTLNAEQLALGRTVIKVLLGALQHTILGLYQAMTTATAILGERKTAFNGQRGPTVQVLTSSKLLGPGANHLHGAAKWLLEPTAESAEVTSIEQQIAAKKAAIIELDEESSDQLNILLAELKALEAKRDAALRELLLHPAQQDWLQLQATLTALKDAATAMSAADPTAVPAAIP